MTDYGLLAIQSVGVLILTFWACWDSRKRGYKAGREDGYRAGYAVGKLDARFPVTTGAIERGSKAC